MSLIYSEHVFFTVFNLNIKKMHDIKKQINQTLLNTI